MASNRLATQTGSLRMLNKGLFMKMSNLYCAPSVLLTVVTPVFAAGAADPFAGRIYQAAAAAIVFIVVLVVLKKAAWGKILEGLQDREKKIRKDLMDAQTAAEKADETLKQYQAKLDKAQAEARSIIEQSRTEAQQLASQMKQKAQDEATHLRQRAESEIVAAKEQAVAQIYAETATLATNVAGRILKREITETDQRQLVDDALGELGKRPQN